MNLKTGAESFEQTMKVKMIMERIMKEFLKSKIIYSFKLIYIHVLVSGITSLSVFNEETLKPSFSWASQIFGFEKCFFFIRIYVLVFLQMRHETKKTIIL